MRFLSPTDYKDLLRLLDTHREARLLAGGTDLLVKLRKNQIERPRVIIDISRLKSLSYITLYDKNIEIGTGTSLRDVISHPSVAENFPSLVHAIENIGSPQIRNRATLGGNICNASPAADSLPVLMALKARVVLESIGGKRTMELDDFIISKSNICLEQGEILKSIIIPLPQRGWQCAFEKLGPRGALAISITSLAVNLCIVDGVIEDALIYSACLGPRTMREGQTEDMLKGNIFNFILFNISSENRS